MLENGVCRRQRQGMANKRAGKEGHAGLGERGIAVLPHATGERVHVAGAASQDSDRQASPHDLPIGRQVGANVEKRLCAPRMSTETGDDFIEDQGGPSGFGDLADLTEKFNWLKRGVAALYR